jgi:hypothetical protein
MEDVTQLDRSAIVRQPKSPKPPKPKTIEVSRRHPSSMRPDAIRARRYRAGHVDALTQESDQHLYVIGDPTGPVKIGKGKDVHQRLRDLQIGNPRPLTLLHVEENVGNLEVLLHRLFKPYWLQGEWFDFGEEDAVALIRAEVRRLSVYRRAS